MQAPDNSVNWNVLKECLYWLSDVYHKVLIISSGQCSSDGVVARHGGAGRVESCRAGTLRFFVLVSVCDTHLDNNR